MPENVKEKISFHIIKLELLLILAIFKLYPTYWIKKENHFIFKPGIQCYLRLLAETEKTPEDIRISLGQQQGH